MRELPTKNEIDYSRLGLRSQDSSAMAQVIQANIRALEPVRTGFGRDHTVVTAETSPNDGDVLKIQMVNYMWMLNNGFKAFVMHQLAGKRIPIRLPTGSIIFRVATAESIGRRRITARDPKSGRIMAGNRPIAWRHPGVAPMRFVERGIANSFPLMGQVVVRSKIRGIINQIQVGKLADEQAILDQITL